MVRKMTHPELEAFLATALDLRASDLHVIAGVPPAFRVNGDIMFADHDALSASETSEICFSLLTEEQRDHFEREWELCVSIPHHNAGRIRATFYKRNGHPELSIRFCGEKVPTREQLGLPSKLDELARKPNGLVLITGPTGSGKTTTVYSMLEVIGTGDRNIVSIEDPVEFPAPFVRQMEVDEGHGVTMTSADSAGLFVFVPAPRASRRVASALAASASRL